MKYVILCPHCFNSELTMMGTIKASLFECDKCKKKFDISYQPFGFNDIESEERNIKEEQPD